MASAAHRFGSVELPRWEADRDRLRSEVLRWLEAEPVRALVAASGWAWPEAEGEALAQQLAALSAGWDFRGGQERNLIATDAAEVDGTALDTGLVEAAASALGLVDPAAPQPGATHLAVLGGLFRACVNRTAFAAGLPLAATLPVAVLSAHRTLGGDEPALAEDAQYGELSDEAEVAERATAEAFGLAGAPATRHVPASSPGSPGGSVHTWDRRGAPPVSVLVASSTDPTRRANTADQLRFWGGEAGLGGESQVLVITTQIYVPFQHLDAIRVLGLEAGCRIDTVGVSDATAVIPLRSFGPRDWLQELRSALRSAQLLLEALGDGTADR